MMAAKAFMGAVGVVSVGASECSNSTLYETKGDSWFQAVAVDSRGLVWLTEIGYGVDDSKVWVCAKDGECRSMGTGWDWPMGIAVDDSGVEYVVYVAEGDDHAPHVKKCTVNWGQDEEFSCSEFGSGWNSPRGLAVDNEGHVLIANAYASNDGSAGRGTCVWKCSPSADCTVVGDSDRWPLYPPEWVAVDSQGNVYVTGGDEGSITDPDYVKKCTSTGTCSDFSGDWPKGKNRSSAIAVGPDDNVYIIDSGTNTLIRCSPDNVCDNVGVVNPGLDAMAIDRNGAFYVVDGNSAERFCLPPSIEDVQV